MCHPYLSMIAIMTIGGLAGGWLNYLQLKKDDPDKSAWRSIVGGLVASFAVPVFLNMISSNLIDSIKGTSTITAEPSKLFVLLGFCLVAAVSSRAFIGTISDRILNEAKVARKEVNQIKNEVQPIIAQATETDPGESQTKFLAKFVSTAKAKVTDEEKSVLDAFANSKYTFRTLSGLSSEVGLDKGHLTPLLEELVKKGWVQSIEIVKEGKPRARWSISEEGRAILTP